MDKYTWDSSLYNDKHSFVPKYGKPVIELLAPKSGEKILDLACGTAILTNLIATYGASVTGMDKSEDMLTQARTAYPDLELVQGDAHNFNFAFQFDAIFSNAALHWMLEPELVLQSVWKALIPGGRFVFEMGGKGNTKIIEDACDYAIKKLGYPAPPRINFFPSVAEYATILEKIGFIIDYALYFKIPTDLECKEGLRNWIKMLRNNYLVNLNEAEKNNFFRHAEEYAAPLLLNDIQEWVADYVRLRIKATKPFS